MAKQTIAIGSAPNDGTGDPLRVAYDKCNQNFTELYDSVVGPKVIDITYTDLLALTVAQNIDRQATYIITDSSQNTLGYGDRLRVFGCGLQADPTNNFLSTVGFYEGFNDGSGSGGTVGAWGTYDIYTDTFTPIGNKEAVYYISGQDNTGFIDIIEKSNNTGTNFTFTRVGVGSFNLTGFNPFTQFIDVSYTKANAQFVYDGDYDEIHTLLNNSLSDDVFEYGGFIKITIIE